MRVIFKTLHEFEEYLDSFSLPSRKNIFLGFFFYLVLFGIQFFIPTKEITLRLIFPLIVQILQAVSLVYLMGGWANVKKAFCYWEKWDRKLIVNLSIDVFFILIAQAGFIFIFGVFFGMENTQWQDLKQYHPPQFVYWWLIGTQPLVAFEEQLFWFAVILVCYQIARKRISPKFAQLLALTSSTVTFTALHMPDWGIQASIGLLDMFIPWAILLPVTRSIFPMAIHHYLINTGTILNLMLRG